MTIEKETLYKYAATLGQRGGRMRAKRLSAERRREIARKAAQVMWGKRRRGSRST